MIEKEFNLVRANYPKLGEFIQTGNGWISEGEIDIIDEEDYKWDKTYSVKILIPEKYPEELPILFETGNEISDDPDWHNSKYSGCCLATTAYSHFNLEGEITLIRWIRIIAYPFLVNHYYRKDHGGEYAGETFSHFDQGVLDGYFKILNADSREDVIDWLRQNTSFNAVPRNKPCFCGSEKKYKKCCFIPSNRKTYHIPISVLQKDLNTIQKLKN